MADRRDGVVSVFRRGSRGSVVVRRTWGKDFPLMRGTSGPAKSASTANLSVGCTTTASARDAQKRTMVWSIKVTSDTCLARPKHRSHRYSAISALEMPRAPDTVELFSHIDAIRDITPVVAYADDLGIHVAALDSITPARRTVMLVYMYRPHPYRSRSDPPPTWPERLLGYIARLFELRRHHQISANRDISIERSGRLRLPDSS